MPRFLVDIAIIVEAPDHIEARNALIRCIGAQAYIGPNVRYETLGEVKVSPLAPLLPHPFRHVGPAAPDRCTYQSQGFASKCGAREEFHAH